MNLFVGSAAAITQFGSGIHCGSYIPFWLGKCRCGLWPAQSVAASLTRPALPAPTVTWLYVGSALLIYWRVNNIAPAAAALLMTNRRFQLDCFALPATN